MTDHVNTWCRAAIALATCLVCATSAFAQNPVADAQIHQRDAAAAYRSGDFASFARSLAIAHQLNPASIATRYNLACGYAKTGQPDKAMELLRGLVAARIDYGMADDPDLESLRDLPEFRSLVRELKANIAPVINSEAFFTVEQLGLIPEGIAFDAASGRLFFGSMRSGDIYALDAGGQLSKFASVDRQGRLAAIGMTVDEDRGLLWVVGTSLDMAENFSADEPMESGVFGFDLSSGELQRKHMIENADLGLNDVALGPNGTLYASGGGLHVLAEDETRLAPLTTTPVLYGSNGVTADPDGKTLYLSSYPVGLAAVDLDSGRLRFLDAPEDTSLYGIDGLYWHDGELIGVQNGIRPWRLLRMSVDESRSAITAAQVIEFANEAATPTTGAIIGDRIHYIGQGPDPDTVPSQFPAELAPFLGKTIIRSAPLRP